MSDIEFGIVVFGYIWVAIWTTIIARHYCDK